MVHAFRHWHVYAFIDCLYLYIYTISTYLATLYIKCSFFFDLQVVGVHPSATTFWAGWLIADPDCPQNLIANPLRDHSVGFDDSEFRGIGHCHSLQSSNRE